MEPIIVLSNQSLLDIAIQHTGSVENSFEFAVQNGISVSDELVSGNDLFIPGDIAFDNDILNYYTSKKIRPATAFTEQNDAPQLGGIGYMRIGVNFKVS